MAKILVALSGGVDSAVAALLLKNQGHEVAAAYIRSWANESGEALFEECPWEEDIQNARAVAEHLNIPFEVIDGIREYREKVVQFLIDGYRTGTTPNPDIMCNREMKFGILKEIARKNGFDLMATGHYARTEVCEDGSVNVLEGADPNKDQSYFLAMLSQAQIRNVVFPVGHLLKPQVREIALNAGLPNATRKDSQGICFLGKVNINQFLSQYIPDRAGEIVHVLNGKVLGEHRGLHHFTIGQRKGIGVPSNTDFQNFVVVAKDYSTHRLMVGFDTPETPGLYEKKFRVNHLNWLNKVPQSSDNLLARPRYRDPVWPVELEYEGKQGNLSFKTPQRALAKGQVVAFYSKQVLAGGGIYI